MNNIKDIMSRESNFIDVFFTRNIPEHIRDFLIGAKATKNEYKDVIISYDGE